MEASFVIQLLINGWALGSVLLLAGVGLTLVYGILGIANFSHADLVTLGAYGLYFFSVLSRIETVEALSLLISLFLLTFAVLSSLVGRGGYSLTLRGGERRALLLLGIFLLLLTLFSRNPLPGPLWGLPRIGGVGVGVGLLLLPSRRIPPSARSFGVWVRDLLSVVLLARAFAEPFWVFAALAGLLTSVAALLTEILVFRPLRKRNATLALVVLASIGVALVLRSLVSLYMGTSYLDFGLPPTPPVTFLGLSWTKDQGTTVLVGVLSALGLHVFLRRSSTGRALRALSDDVELARVSGIDVERSLLYVWLLAGFFAGVAGALLPLNNINVNPETAPLLLLVVFAAVILGGIGNPYGAMVGSWILGVAMELSAGLWRPEYKYAVAFVVLVGTLLWNPRGILRGRGG